MVTDLDRIKSEMLRPLFPHLRRYSFPEEIRVDAKVTESHPVSIQVFRHLLVYLYHQSFASSRIHLPPDARVADSDLTDTFCSNPGFFDFCIDALVVNLYHGASKSTPK